jgi:hydroxybutyrate-dimer hydrolase
MNIHCLRIPAAVTAVAAALTACGDISNDVRENFRPTNVLEVTTTAYDGTTDDLLTAGLGRTGLASATPPAVVDPLNPTAAELRKLAIYNNYRALVDMTAAGGFGTLYGPNVAVDGTVGAGEGRIAGSEVIALASDGTTNGRITLMVQIPDTFDRQQPCIVTATSSGSRGVYGGISTGEWGLKRACAVAYTDKGTGAAPYDVMNDTVPLVDGRRATAVAAGASAAFRANVTDADRATFNAATPNRFAFKHAHSERNPEGAWGTFTLQAIEFAFWALNERYGDLLPSGARSQFLTPRNTLVIASSISNGGGAAIAAAEQDGEGLIDAVAVAEPAVEMPATLSVSVQRGGATPVTFGKTLFDFTSYANLFQSCAALSTQVAGAPGLAFINASFAANRCASLRAKGLLTATTTATQADEALQRLRDYGWEAEAAILHASHAAFEIVPAVTVTFANGLAAASVIDNLCGFSFGAVTAGGTPTALAPAALATMFGTGNGIPPAAGITIINNNSTGGPLRDLLSFSPTTGLQDFNVDGAICLRGLLEGTSDDARALQGGLSAVRRNGNLRGRPAIIVHGRDDVLLPVNHTSRPYTALNKAVEGGGSRLSYIEVTNAQHFDAFIGLPTVLPGYDTRYVPLHLYLIRALDAMWAHLKTGAPLPPSQVVRTVARGGVAGAAPAITAANVPPIASAPAAGDVITMSGSTLQVPD